MKMMGLLGLLALALTGCSKKSQIGPRDLFADLPSDTEQITLLATNDIHGGLEPSFEKKEGPLGGMAHWAGVVRAIKNARRESKRPSDVFVLDAGDQFQGTLVSNINEGKLMLDAMIAVGYDAVIPGNHDYDFGPEGWLKDTVGPGENPANSKEVFKKLTERARGKFPFLSANTYLVDSLKDKQTKKAVKKEDIKNNFCEVKKGIELEWSKAKRPSFLGDYAILTSPRLKARVAVIGLDNPKTATQTMTENVSDLCFRDPYDTYVDLRKKLNGKADIFVIVIHDGNTDKTKEASKLAEKLLNNGSPLVDAVVAGHTHFFNSETPGGVPVIQSRYGGRYFGRIDLFWSPTKNLLRDRTKQYAALRMYHDRCDKFATDFCTAENGEVYYENQKVVADKSIEDLIQATKADFKGIDQELVAHSHDELARERINESPLTNIVADGMLAVARLKHPETAVALINASGVRADIGVGPVTFDEFFMMLPFNNKELVVGPMKTKALIELIQYSAKTCGAFGSLMPAGLRVTIERKCPEKNGDLDPDAKLLQVVQLLQDGTSKVIYDLESKVEPKDGDEIIVATLDFLAKGGEGFSQLALPQIDDLGVAREELFKLWKQNPPTWSKANLDGRWTAKPRP